MYGGNSFDIRNSGPKDQRRLEARADVLVFTSPPLGSDLTIIGHVKARLFVSTSNPYADVICRLCSVEPDGRSINLTDGLCRLKPTNNGFVAEGGAQEIEVDMWVTAAQFRAGSRVRVHICSGAHPNVMRNLGTASQVYTSVDEAKGSTNTIFLNADMPSCVVLPVIPAREEVCMCCGCTVGSLCQPDNSSSAHTLPPSNCTQAAVPHHRSRKASYPDLQKLVPADEQIF